MLFAQKLAGTVHISKEYITDRQPFDFVISLVVGRKSHTMTTYLPQVALWRRVLVINFNMCSVQTVSFLRFYEWIVKMEVN